MLRGSLASVRGFDRSVYAVAGGRFINFFGNGLVYPFATIHFHLFLGIPLGLVGLGLLANNVATAVGTAFGGFLADRIGRKPVMVVSMALSAFTLAAYALVTDAAGFIAVATASGLTFGLYAPASQAMVADLTADATRDQAFALLKVGSNAGFGLGFVAGGLLYEAAKTAVFVADGITSGVVALLLLVALPRVHSGVTDVSLRESVGDWGRAITRRRVVALALLNLGFAIMYAQMQATVPVVAKGTLGLSSSEIGTLWVLNPLVIVLFQLPLVSMVTTRGWRRTRGLVVSAALWATSMAAVWTVESVPWVFGVVLVGGHLVFRTLGEILHAPLATSLGSDLGRAAERGSHLSLLEIAKRLGMGLGAAVGGMFFDYGLANLLWPTLILVCGVIALGALALERRVTPAENGLVTGADSAEN